jgi:hypothetical protein
MKKKTKKSWKKKESNFGKKKGESWEKMQKKKKHCGLLL